MIGKAIKEIRIKRGMTQQKLAEETKLSYSLISKIEQGTINDPGIKTMAKIAHVLKISLDSICKNKI
ncbi:MAG: helix-turn-helix transcriptional regulator [bacterium]